MKIFKSLASGFCRTLKAWKGILLIWFGSLLMVSLLALPLKGFLKSGFGDSMITERLHDGLDIEVLGDLGSVFKGLMASIPSGLFLLLLFGILLNAFLSGGIFNSLRGSASKFSGNEFFSAGARNFWPFLVISLIIGAIILVLLFLSFILPVTIVAQSDLGSETATFMTVIISATIFLFLAIIFILVADYARAWQAANETSECFRAIGFGFTRTFGKILSSFPMMVILVAFAILFTSLVFSLIGNWTPDSGGGVFLLFIISQILFFIKSGIKVWRYGSVTALKEINDIKEQKSEIFVNPVIEV
jgi:hypothetical protein